MMNTFNSLQNRVLILRISCLKWKYASPISSFFNRFFYKKTYEQLLEEFKIDYANKTSEYNRYAKNDFGKYNLIFKYEFVYPEEHKEKLKLLNNLKNIGKTEVQVNENELKFILRFLNENHIVLEIKEKLGIH
jgi:hypothetical protein